MKTTKKNTLSLAAIEIVLTLGASLTYLSQPAAANITTGFADGPIICDSNHSCSTDKRLNVGPGPGVASGPANPADYGMCGVLHLSGAFVSSTVARIVVGSDGYYHAQTAWVGSPTSGPQLEWTCVLFADFTGLPYEYVKGLSTYEAPVVTAKDGGKATNMFGAADACIWAGLAGPLTTTDRESVSVFAQFDGSYTLASAQSAPKTTLETYAFCSSIKGFPWTPFLNNVVAPGFTSTSGKIFPVTFPAPGSKPGVIGNRWWCYMDGAGTAGQSGPSVTQKFNLGGLAYISDDKYYFTVGKESALWFNCMGLDQAPLTY